MNKAAKGSEHCPFTSYIFKYDGTIFACAIFSVQGKWSLLEQANEVWNSLSFWKWTNHQRATYAHGFYSYVILTNEDAAQRFKD